MRKTAFITGASRGIGRATALAFARAGYYVAANYNASQEAARSLLKQAAQEGGMMELVPGDVSDAAQVRAMFEGLHKTLGHVDVLVNNAGIACDKTFLDTTREDWERVFSVNATGMFNCTQAALGFMLPQKQGCILNLSSMWGLTGGSCEVAYSASKAAVIGFTKALAKELGPSGIRVNCVAPGVIKTDMNAGLRADDLAALREETPLGRIGTPEDVARSLLFLASPDAGFITGQVLSPNGGFVI